MEYLCNNQLQMKLYYIVLTQRTSWIRCKQTVIKLLQGFKSRELLNEETLPMLILLTQIKIKKRTDSVAMRKSIIQF